MPAKPLLEFNDCGIYCSRGDFYIDPWKPVNYAVITHAHSDHARPGNKNYLSHHLSREILKYRLGEIQLQTVGYQDPVTRNGVTISFHPAGHIIGSSQIRVEFRGEVWVVSGDYKLEDDGISTPFEPVKCHSFISECTFGLPVFRWRAQSEVFGDINTWWKQNQQAGRISILAGYSLGKAQRILHNLDRSLGRVFTHGVIENTHQALRRNGVMLPETTYITPEIGKEELRDSMILCPPSAIGTPWIKRFNPFSFGYCSGWMTLRGAKRRMAADRGFVISDHADWEGLISAVKATGCESVYLTHGYTAPFSRYLCDLGFDAHEAQTLYQGDEVDSLDEAPAEILDESGHIIQTRESQEDGSL
jgi:putative mRNA 3-end processing factor